MGFIAKLSFAAIVVCAIFAVSYAHQAEEETCSNGLVGINGSNENGDVCCPLDCGRCGGRRCGSGRRTKECCIDGVLNNQDDCSVSMAAPCIITGDTTPAPVTSGETCSNGLPGITGVNDNGEACCPLDCGLCGGKGCRAGRRKKECCIDGVLNNQDDCSVSMAAPCFVVDAPPTPAPSTPAPSTPAPSTPAPSTPAPSTPAPSTPAPSTPAPSTPAPTETAPFSCVDAGGELVAFYGFVLCCSPGACPDTSSRESVTTTDNYCFVTRTVPCIDQGYPSCDESPHFFVGDGYCDENTNNAECGWDHGDCCAETCCPGQQFLCGEAGFPCNDPDPANNPRVCAVEPQPALMVPSTSPYASNVTFDD